MLLAKHFQPLSRGNAAWTFGSNKTARLGYFRFYILSELINLLLNKQPDLA